jgi:hypothetical protein
MEDRRDAHRVFCGGRGDLRERAHLEDLDVDGLKLILKKWDGTA